MDKILSKEDLFEYINRIESRSVKYPNAWMASREEIFVELITFGWQFLDMGKYIFGKPSNQLSEMYKDLRLLTIKCSKCYVNGIHRDGDHIFNHCFKCMLNASLRKDKKGNICRVCERRPRPKSHTYCKVCFSKYKKGIQDRLEEEKNIRESNLLKEKLFQENRKNEYLKKIDLSIHDIKDCIKCKKEYVYIDGGHQFEKCFKCMVNESYRIKSDSPMCRICNISEKASRVNYCSPCRKKYKSLLRDRKIEKEKELKRWELNVYLKRLSRSTYIYLPNKSVHWLLLKTTHLPFL